MWEDWLECGVAERLGLSWHSGDLKKGDAERVQGRWPEGEQKQGAEGLLREMRVGKSGWGGEVGLG
jgi:hypothetical protein